MYSFHAGMNDFERAIWSFPKTDRYDADNGKESSNRSGSAEQSIHRSNTSPSQPIIYQPPQTIGRRVEPEKIQEEKQEDKEKLVKKQKHKKNDWEKIRLALAAEEAMEDEGEREEELAEADNSRNDHDVFTGEDPEANASEGSGYGGFLKAFMNDNSTVSPEPIQEDSLENSESTHQRYNFPVIDWLEAALERPKCEDRNSLGSFSYSSPEIPCEKPERNALSFQPGGTIRKQKYSMVKLPVCLASLDLRLDLNRNLDIPLPVSRVNQVDWDLTAVKGKVVLPEHTVFLVLILTATIEVVCDDRLQLIKIDVPIEKTFQADWKKEPVIPFSKSREYMFLCPKRKQISTHRESYQTFAEEIEFSIPYCQIISHEELLNKQDATGLSVTGHVNAKLELTQSQYVKLAKI
ncbi:hypothetical protein [Thalassobacillus devorans]|uniref:hypothetical protein n=1 Tax=Thalassobacillus devorans TaxID=279813 RepID=UPI00048DEB61|nr:hypothetical protein [Thalassobacillus devorans]